MDTYTENLSQVEEHTRLLVVSHMADPLSEEIIMGAGIQSVYALQNAIHQIEQIPWSEAWAEAEEMYRKVLTDLDATSVNMYQAGLIAGFRSHERLLRAMSYRNIFTRIAYFFRKQLNRIITHR